MPKTQTPTLDWRAVLNADQQTCIASIADRAVGHYEGVPSLFLKDYLPRIVEVEVGTDAAGQPTEVRTIDPDLFAASLLALADHNRARALDKGGDAKSADANMRKYKQRILAKVTEQGIAVPGFEDQQADVTETQTAAAADDAFAEDIVATGDPIAAVVEALQTQQWSRARAIIRAMQRAAKGRK